MQAVNRFLRSLPVLRQINGFGLQAEPIVIKPPGNVQAPRDREYDFGPYPNGWIQIAWSWELPPGQVRPLRCMGHELVLFRGHDGKANVLDAYCPHLGAHLGVGGTVVGNDIRCPFHGWQFSGEGTCTQVPFARKIPPKAQVACWTVREQNGFIFLWYDAEKRAPWFEMPQVPEYGAADWTEPLHRSYRIRTRWRELIENGLDRAHFPALHGYPEPPAVEFEALGPHFKIRSKVPWRRFGRDIEVILDFDGHGPGMAVAHGVGEAPFTVVGCPMPIDEDTVLHRMTFMVSKKVPLPIRGLVARFLIYSARSEFERDIPIWEAKVHRSRPVLSDVDGPIGRYRQWARQFYAAPAAAAAKSSSSSTADAS